MTNRGIGVLIGVGAVATVLEAVLIDSPAGDTLYFAVTVVLCFLTWHAAVRRRPDGHRTIWVLLAVTQTLALLGDAVQTWQFHHGGAPLAGPSDLLWLGSYPPQTLALILMARHRAPGQLRAAALDALALTTAAGIASYLFFVEPLFDQGRLTVAETLVPAAYPIGDLTFLAGVLVLVLSGGRRGAPTRLLLTWGGLSLVTNVGYNVLPYVVGSAWVERFSALALFANVLVTAVVLHPGRGELTAARQRSTTMHPARGIFLGIALMTAPVLVVVDSGMETGAWFEELLATALCAALVVARFMIAVREQERAQAQLAYQARRDPLTGLANRALLGEHLEQDGPAVLLYLDLDGFKGVNDSRGHEAGDAVLIAVAERLTRAVRAGDVVARLGGDEFVVACPGATVADGVALAERILLDIDAPVPFSDNALSVGASIGIAVHDASPRMALRSADEAMYRAKRLGRGRWILAG